MGTDARQRKRRLRVCSMVLAPDRSRVIVGWFLHHHKRGSLRRHGICGRDLPARLALGGKSENTQRGRELALSQPTGRWHANLWLCLCLLARDGIRELSKGRLQPIPTTGNITVVNDCHGDTYDVLPLDGVLYSVGHAHDCTWVGEFPDTNPRVRWQRALAQTIAPTTSKHRTGQLRLELCRLAGLDDPALVPSAFGRQLYRHRKRPGRLPATATTSSWEANSRG